MNQLTYSTTAQWAEHHEDLRAADDPQPYRVAGEAYRRLVDLSDNLSLEGRTSPLSEPELTEVEGTLRAVEQAIFTLRQADR